MRKYLAVALVLVIIAIGVIASSTAHDQNPSVVILTFHDVSSTDKSLWTITPARFASDVQDLLQQGYHVITLQQAIDFAEGKGQVPKKAVVITADDGYVGMYTSVFPVLKHYHLPATCFIITGMIGHNPHFLTWNEARVMQASGLVTFGAHTYNSHREIQVSPNWMEPATIGYAYNPKTGKTETRAAYRKRIYRDCMIAQAQFQKELGHRAVWFAYPYGAYTPQLDNILRSAGYKYYFTETPGVITRGMPGILNQHHLYRVDVGTSTLQPATMIARIKGTDRPFGLNRLLTASNIVKWPCHAAVGRLEGGKERKNY